MKPNAQTPLLDRGIPESDAFARTMGGGRKAVCLLALLICCALLFHSSKNRVPGFGDYLSNDKLLPSPVLKARGKGHHEPTAPDNIPTASVIAPHILFVYVDEMGYGDIGYNNVDIAFATKYMDTLAEEGIKLTSYYGQQSCTPSRAALMTGHYPINIGMQFKDIDSSSAYGVPLEFNTLGDYMTRVGYQTHFLGKWNIGHFAPAYLPDKRGFDSFLCYFDTTEEYYNYKDTTAVDGHNWFDLLESNTSSFEGWSPALAYIGEYSTALYTKKTKEIIESYIDPGTSDDPLFVLLATQAVHGPEERPPTKEFTTSDIESIEKIRRSMGESRAVLAEMLLYLDIALEKIVRKLEESGLLSETLIVLASDNGACPSENGGLNSPLRGQKGTLWEGGVHVPAFVYSESVDLIPASAKGSSYTKLFHCTDWLPTLLAAGAAPVIPKSIDGVDQWGALTGRTTGTPRTWLIHNINVYNLNSENEIVPLGYTYAALRVGDMKLLLNEFNESVYTDTISAPSCKDDYEGGNVSMLFNISADPYETTNLWYHYPEIVHELRMRVEDLKNKMYSSVYRTDSILDAVSVWKQHDRFVTPWLDVYENPTAYPTHEPSSTAPGPTTLPTYSSQPTTKLTNAPSDSPSEKPSSQPTAEPTNAPSDTPSQKPSYQPTTEPTNTPSDSPSQKPSHQSTTEPTNVLRFQ